MKRRGAHRRPGDTAGSRPAAPAAGTLWTAARAEEHLLGLELFGMRFGLERMRRLLLALGSPQRSFRAVHVVGTNGKSSVTRMTAALLQAHGMRAGAYLSPHLGSFAERIRIADADLDPDAFGAAVWRAARAAERVERGEEERVTQFELITAAAFSEFAARGVEVAVVEAGLGGRFDATNVLDAETVVLTSVGLEHTRWLGPTRADIAREKLAVVSPGARLIVGADLHPEARAVAQPLLPYVAPAADHGIRGYQRRNFDLAVAAAQTIVDLAPVKVDEVAAKIAVPGRMQVVDREPLTIFDGAHNADGVAALAGAIRELGRDRVVAAVSILDDKDAAAMIGELATVASALVLTSNPNPRALPPATLHSLAGQCGISEREIEPDPRRAVARARELAGRDGVAVATGSIYLVAELLRDETAAARQVSRL